MLPTLAATARGLAARPWTAAAAASATRAAMTCAHRAFSTDYADVAILGSGVAGAALACALAQAPELATHKLALIDSADLTRRYTPASDDQWSNRVVSLTPRSVQFLQDLGVWDAIPSARRHPYEHMKVWDACSNGRADFSAETVSSPAIAYMVEVPYLQSALLEVLHAQHADRITVHSGAAVTTPLARDDSGDTDAYPILDLGSEKIAARVLVGSDGANSRVRSDLVRTSFFGRDYGRVGLVATVAIDPTQGNATAWQRFLPTGPLAMLPLSDTHSSLVWTLPPAMAAKAAALPEDQFVALVNAAFFYPPAELAVFLGNELELDIAEEVEWRDEVYEHGVDLDRVVLPPYVEAVQDGSRAAFPLRLRHAMEYTAHRAVLVGDAAHLIHPLAGQGLNLGLGDVECLSRVLRTAASTGQDLGHAHVLETYARERYPVNAAMLTACDALHHLFGTDAAPVAWIRSFGLNRFNQLDLVKRTVMRATMGEVSML
ncbi:putative ubiquinone biosynthesis monooxygenase [Allomyces arbusculus]|nr:putative ubiquinone biosynthesis monooxygenase [Allomyces arbusculus]